MRDKDGTIKVKVKGKVRVNRKGVEFGVIESWNRGTRQGPSAALRMAGERMRMTEREQPQFIITNSSFLI
jgi:hypothetical protein